MSVRSTLLGAGLVATIATATLSLGATGASAATVVTAPVAGTTQTIFFHANHNGSYKNQAPISFSKKTFTVPRFGDTGTFTNRHGKLRLTVSSAAQNGDAGCKFSAVYKPAKLRYIGTYACPDGFHDDFAVTAVR